MPSGGQRVRSGVAVAVGALVGIGLQAIGLVDARWLVGWSACVVVTIGLAFVLERQRPVRWEVPAFALVVAALWTGAQLVPLPQGLLASVAPKTFELRTFGLDPSHGRWFPATVDGPATWTELLKYGTYAALALAVGLCNQNRRSRLLLAWVIVAAGVAFTLSTLAHTILAPSRIFGVYQPTYQTWGLIKAPLVNSNHVAGVFSAFAPLTFAMSLRLEGRRRQVLTLTAALQIALALATLSRAGALACLIGVTLVVIGLSGRSGSLPRMPRREIVILVALAVGAVLYFGYEQVEFVVQRTREAGLAREGKLRVWRDSMDLVRDNWALGVGRGTWAVAFPRFRDLSLKSALTFDYPENLVLQWMGEWGVVFATCALVAVGLWLKLIWSRRGSSRLRTGAIAGLTALLTQNLADFSLELPAVAGLAVVLACLAVPPPAGDRSTFPRAKRVGGVIVALAVTLVLALAGATIAGHSHRQDGVLLARALSTTDRLPREAATMLDRHSADYGLPLLLGEWGARAKHPDALRWLNRALYLNPRGAAIHIAIARALARGGLANQAVLELRLAHGEDPSRGRELAGLLVRWYPDQAHFLRFIGTGRRSGSRAIFVAEHLREGGRWREYAGVCRTLSERRERDLKTFGLACLGEASRFLGDRPGATRAARALLASGATGDLDARALEVLTWASADEVDPALRRALERHGDDGALLAIATTRALAQRRWEDALDHARSLERTTGTNGALLGRALVLQGRAQLGAGRALQALVVCERAIDLDADAPEALQCACEAALGARQLHGARAHCGELEARGQLDALLREKLRALEPSGGR